MDDPTLECFSVPYGVPAEESHMVRSRRGDRDPGRRIIRNAGIGAIHAVIGIMIPRSGKLAAGSRVCASEIDRYRSVGPAPERIRPGIGGGNRRCRIHRLHYEEIPLKHEGVGHESSWVENEKRQRTE